MKTWRHAIVTGGCSGLGLGFATRLLRRGTRVSVLDRTITDEARRALGDAGSGALLLEADVSDADAVSAAVARAIAEHGDPDLAINCAGILIISVLPETSPSAFARIVDVNLNGSFNVASAILPHMRPGARLALVASVAGLTGNYGYSAYAASKFGVVGLATTLRYEYDARGIGISCICPPEVRTPMVADELAGKGDAISRALKLAAGSLDVDVAVDAMLAGIDRGQWMIIPGTRAKWVAALHRHLPSANFAIANRIVRKHLGKRSKPGAGDASGTA